MPFVGPIRFVPVKTFQATQLVVGHLSVEGPALSSDGRAEPWGHLPGTLQACVGNTYSAQAAATVQPKQFYLNDYPYDLDSIFVKHRCPPTPKKFNK